MNSENREQLRPIWRARAENAAAYQYLLNLYPGKFRESLRRLYEGELETVACLRGLAQLAGEPVGKLRFPPAPRESMGRLLHRAFHATAGVEEACRTRAGEPETGKVYAQLAGQAGERCLVICQILGRL